MEDIFSKDYKLFNKVTTVYSVDNVFTYMDSLWKVNKEKTIKAICLIRRDSKFNLDKELKTKDQFRKRLYWLATKHWKEFSDNIVKFVEVGSWKDIFKLFEIDIDYNKPNTFSWTKMAKLLGTYLVNPDTTSLVRKYLPTICSNPTTPHAKNNRTIGKFLCAQWHFSEKTYRVIKSKGRAHLWQQAISREEYESINVNTIPLIAYNQLSKSKIAKKYNIKFSTREIKQSKSTYSNL